MLDKLKLVQGGVAKKDFQPLLTFFHIYAGRVQGTNGRLTIDSVCHKLCGIEATVHCEKLLKAVASCGGEPKIRITEAGNMLVSKGSFRARLPLGEHEKYPRTDFPEEEIKCPPPPNLIAILRRLQPFIGEDATRPWMSSILFRKGFAYATNNPILVRLWAGDCQEMVLPGFLVDELVRLNLTPKSMVVKSNGIFITFEEDLWIRSSVIADTWPAVEDMLNKFHANVALAQIPKELCPAIDKILPFCPDPKFPEIVLTKDGVSTGTGDMSAEVTDLCFPESKWHANNLKLILTEATKIDMTAWPSPCPWVGDKIQGVITGLRN